MCYITNKIYDQCHSVSFWSYKIGIICQKIFNRIWRPDKLKFIKNSLTTLINSTVHQIQDLLASI